MVEHSIYAYAFHYKMNIISQSAPQHPPIPMFYNFKLSWTIGDSSLLGVIEKKLILKLVPSNVLIPDRYHEEYFGFPVFSFTPSRLSEFN
jgi:hypothetical protein